MTGYAIARASLKFIQYAALMGSIYNFAYGNYVASIGLLLLALSLEKMIVELGITVCQKQDPQLHRLAFEVEDNYSYLSQGALRMLSVFAVSKPADNSPDLEMQASVVTQKIRPDRKL